MGVAGFIIPLLPETIITNIVRQNMILRNLEAFHFEVFIYFSLLIKISNLAGTYCGMHSGFPLALLIAGINLSLPNMLVVRRPFGTKKSVYNVDLTKERLKIKQKEKHQKEQSSQYS